MKKILLSFCLALLVLTAIVDFSPANVPPCDEYLDCCIFTYCRDYINPDAYLSCVNKCAENYTLNCR